MLQAHSFLWHYLWVAPNIFLLVLAILIWKCRLHKQIPAFFIFSIVAPVGQLALYAADVLPFVRPEWFWRIDWADLIVQALLKLLVISEIFANVFGQYASIAGVGKTLIRATGVFIVLLATFLAAYAPRDGAFAIVSGANFLEQTTYIVECGLIVFIYLFSAYFHLSWDRTTVGITVGLGLSACVHLAVWAVLVNSGLPDSARSGLIFVKMGAYHFSVLLWLYYLVTATQRIAIAHSAVLPENNLALWNRELERLLQ